MASVLITGTSKGIGLETALHLGRAGHTVYATMRNPAGLTELGRAAAAEMLPIHVSAMDVDSDESVAAAMAEIEQLAGTMDVLVNNAGIARNGTVEELPLDEFRAVMETNYFGALRCIKAVVGAMRKRRQRLHHQRDVDCGEAGHVAAGAVCGEQVCAGGGERGAGAGDEDVWGAGGDCGAGNYRHVDGAIDWRHELGNALSAGEADAKDVSGHAGRSGGAAVRGGEDQGDYRERDVATAARGGAERRRRRWRGGRR